MASKLRVDEITGGTGSTVSIGTATFTGGLSGDITGLNVTGVITATTFSQTVGAGGSITVGDSFVKSGAVGLGTTTTAGRNAGVSTAIGTLIYNETLGQVQVFKRVAGRAPVSSPAGDYTPISATGGTVETYTDPSNSYQYKSHTFLSSDPGLVVSALSGNPDPAFNTLEYLLVGGGGGNYGGDTSPTGGSGGSGIVIIAYPTA